MDLNIDLIATPFYYPHTHTHTYYTDGQAATRDPEDLVGQGVLFKFQSSDSAQWSRATVELGGRGAFGELVTGKRK